MSSTEEDAKKECAGVQLGREILMENMRADKEEEEEDNDDNLEEDDLFEINLDVVNYIPPPNYYWDCIYFTATTHALFANCLLPIADVSSAIPTLPEPCDHHALTSSWPAPASFWPRESSTPRKFLDSSDEDSFEFPEYNIEIGTI